MTGPVGVTRTEPAPVTPPPAAATTPAAVTLPALRWLDDRRRHFRLPAGVAEEGTDHNATLKPLGELAQLSLSIARVSPSGGAVHRTALALLDFAWRETGRGELYLELARAEPHATHLLELYVPFADAGLRHPGFEDFAHTMARTRSWAATEQEPTRMLSLLRAEQRLKGSGTPRGGAEWDSATTRTWLGRMPEPWALECRSGYALTHHVFHVTDWGSRPCGLPAEPAGYLAHWLPAWLDSCLEAENWDLAGELLAVGACLPEAALDLGAWDRYAAAQSDSGAFAESGSVPEADDRAAFLACYHATLVAAFASALAATRSGEGVEA